jgi:hypothetical protein
MPNSTGRNQYTGKGGGSSKASKSPKVAAAPKTTRAQHPKTTGPKTVVTHSAFRQVKHPTLPGVYTMGVYQKKGPAPAKKVSSSEFKSLKSAMKYG